MWNDAKLKKKIENFSVILLGIILVGTYLIIESIFHVVFYQNPNLILNLITFDLHEVWMRSVTIFIIFYFSVLIQFQINKNRKITKTIGESEEKFRGLFENMSSGVAIYEAFNDGEDFIFKDFNKSAEKMEKIKRNELIGKKVSEIFPNVKEFGLFDVFKRVWKTNIPEHHPISLYEDQRILGWRENYVYKLDSGEIVAVYDDVTEQKKAAEELKESEDNYKRAFNKASFYQDIFGHDINNILQNILSSSSILSMMWNSSEKNEEEIKVLMEAIKNQVKRGANLVSNIHKLSNLEDSEIKLEPIELIQILKKAIDNTIEGFKEKPVEIQLDFIEKEIFINANELLIDVFNNLLFNSIKHNDNPKIEINIQGSKIQQHDKNFIRIQIEDNGRGIEDERKKLVFERGNHARKKASGMGLGLSLVSKVLESYKGKIWIEDRVEGNVSKGSKFILLIPEGI